MIIEYTDEDGPRCVVVHRAYAAAVARTIADDVGVVKLNGELVQGPASDADRALYIQWERAS